MASAAGEVLGKRKRKNEIERGNTNDDSLLSVFRQAFEKRFAPLESEQKQRDQTEEVAETEESDSSWSGVSSDWHDDSVPVHTSSLPKTREQIDKTTFKEFMSSHPPNSFAPKLQRKQEFESEDEEAENLRNDIDLQNLLLGKTRLSEVISQKSRSVFEQGNVPMKIRQGVKRKREERENNRREQAKEAGIILEKALHKKKHVKMRERAVGGPSVGKFSGGMLKLNQRDIREIQGQKGIKRKK